MKEKLNTLGHILFAQGTQPCEVKVDAIQQAPAPANISELRAYLGLINYYRKYLPNIFTVLAPLYALLQKGKPWRWSSAQQKTFEA